MKEGWEYIALSSVCRVQNGFAFNSKLFNDSNKGLPLIRIRDIKRGFSLTYTDEACSDDFFVEDGDMLIGMDGDFNIGEWKGGHALLNQRVCKLIPSEKVLAKFIFYFIPEALQRINDKTAFSTVKHLSSKQVNAISLPKLDLSEQQRIVDYLDSAFAKIDAMKANAEKALNEAKALFQASLKEMLEPKEGWEEKKVGEVAEIKGGKRIPKGEKLLSEPTTHKYIRVADFNEYGTVDLGDIRYISDNVYEQIKRYIINKEDVYISIAGTIGKSGIIPEELDGANLTENACRLILSKEIYQRFMYYTTISPEFIRQEIESTKISAQPKLALTRLADIIIAYPSIVEQQNIAATLDSLKSKVDRLQENYTKISQECDALKQAILRQVFE
jgi:type I restriction enzyme S subunit